LQSDREQCRETEAAGEAARLRREPAVQETAARLALLEAGLSCSAARQLLQRCGSGVALWRGGAALLPGGAGGAAAALDGARRSLESLAARGVRVLAPGESEFPAVLAQIPDPPLLLFLRGRLPEGAALAVVGSRSAGERSRAVAHELARRAAEHGAAVVSGLAYGIDAAAHRGCLAGGGATVAVLASGVDCPSPSGNRALADQILSDGGAWLSEQLPGAGARPRHFPERNRLISGLARATLVVEARERSGTLWTARHALEQGRDVAVVPGAVDTDAARGSNRLLREGALAVLDADDLLDLLFGVGVRPRSAARGLQRVPASDVREGLSGAARRVLAALGDGPRDPDTLGCELGLGAAQLAAPLLELELAGLLERVGARLALSGAASAVGGGAKAARRGSRSCYAARDA
jgi:DNA processing protein